MLRHQFLKYTLWDNETYFLEVERGMCDILAPYGDAQTISDSLFQVEMANMDDYGYGAMAFTLSLVENAVKVSHGAIPATDIARIVELGRTLLRLKATPLEGVEATLRQLKASDAKSMDDKSRARHFRCMGC